MPPINEIKRKGASADTCGTAYFTIFSLDRHPRIVVYCFLPSRKD